MFTSFFNSNPQAQFSFSAPPPQANFFTSYQKHNFHNMPTRSSTRCKQKKAPAPPPVKDPPVVYDLYLSLEDILIGCTKKMKIERNVLNPDKACLQNPSVVREGKILTINVKPGWKAGTKITFKEEGDQRPGAIPSDIIFVVKDKPHEFFTRDGSNVKYTCNITLKQVFLFIFLTVVCQCWFMFIDLV